MAEPTARTVALDVLSSGGLGPPFAAERLDAALRKHNLAAVERGFATELVYGVLRRRATVDALIEPFLKHRPPPVIHNVLRLGTYQLALLDRPAYAVIDTAVALVRRPADRGFVNAVLRNVSRLLSDTADNGPASDTLPLSDGAYRRLTQRVFADPGEAPVQYLSAAFALPSWLVERWVSRWGFAECVRLGFWFAGPGPLWLRINPLKTTRDSFMTNVAAVVGPGPQSVRMDAHAVVTGLPGFEDGHFSVQDTTSQEVAALLGPQPGWSVLDRCAAPGGKATHLAELMGDRGRVIACDVDGRKLATVAGLATRLGLGSVETVKLRREDPAPAGPFDAAIVDAPCSNTGVLHRRPEARWRLRPADVSELAALQTRLLLDAVDRVRPGGRLVYSTCSIEPEENEEVVRAALAARPALSLEVELDAVPGRPSDGGYRALLRVA